MSELLKKDSTITECFLHTNYIGDVGAISIGEALKSNNTLTKLPLYENKIGDAGADGIAQGLKSNSKVTAVSLQKNQIGDTGAISIGDMLKSNNIVKILYLTENHIGHAGAIGIAKGLEGNRTVHRLGLGQNQIDYDGCMILKSAWLKLRNIRNSGLEWSGQKAQSNATVTDQKRQQEFNKQKLDKSTTDADNGNNQILSNQAADLKTYIEQKYGVQALNYTNVKMNQVLVLFDQDIMNKPNSNDIKVISFANTEMNTTNIEQVARMVSKFKLNLDALHFRDNPQLGDTGVKHFIDIEHSLKINHPNYHHIRHLDLSNCNLTNNSAKIISEALINGDLSDTKSLNVSDNHLDDHSAMFFLNAMRYGPNSPAALQVLKLTGNPMSQDIGPLVVKALQNIKEGAIVLLKEMSYTGDSIKKMRYGTREEKIAEYKKVIKQSTDSGANNKAIVVDKSFLGEVKAEVNVMTEYAIGFAKCYLIDDMVEDYTRDKLVAKIPKQGVKTIARSALKTYDVFTCLAEAEDYAWTSDAGQRFATRQLCLLGEKEFCGDDEY